MAFLLRHHIPAALLVLLVMLVYASHAFSAAPRQEPPAWIPGGQPQAASSTGDLPPLPLPGYSSTPTVMVNGNKAIPKTAPSGVPPAHVQKNSQGADGMLGISLPWGDYLEALALICFALAVLLCALWLFKKLSSGTAFFRPSASSKLVVENRLAIAPKKWILVVRAEDKRLIVGVTDHSINLLSEQNLAETPLVLQPPRVQAPAHAAPQAAPLHQANPQAAPRQDTRVAPGSPLDDTLPGITLADLEPGRIPQAAKVNPADNVFAKFYEKSKDAFS